MLKQHLGPDDIIGALKKIGITVPYSVVSSLLSADQQTKGCSHFRCVHHGDKTLMLWDDPAGFELPEHSHPTETQFSAVIDGKFMMTVAGKQAEYGPRSDAATIPPATKHSGKAMTRCAILDVFQPRRQDCEGVEVTV